MWPDNTFVDFDNNLNVAVKRLRDALRDSAEGPRFVETLPRRGYRFVAPVEWIDAEPAAQSEPVQEKDPAVRAGAQRWLWPGAGVLTIALIGLAPLALRPWGERGDTIVAGTGSAWDAGAPVASDTRKRIVVLPLANLGPEEDSYLAAGFTDGITSRLAAVGDLAVIFRSSASRYDRSGKTMEEIGRELGVDYVLDGTVRWHEGSAGQSRVRVAPELIEVASSARLWSNRYDQAMENIFHIQSEIAARVVEQLGLTPDGAAREAIDVIPTGNMKAYQSYLKGKELIDEGDGGEDKEEGLRLVERAVKFDPEFALAWAYLSTNRSASHHFRVDLTEENLTQARVEADRALKSNPHLGDARKALGYYYYWGRRDYERALHEFHKVRGWKNDPDVLQAVASIERRQGKFEEALAAFQRAQSLDPQNVDRFGELVATYLILGRWAEAEEAVAQAFAMSEDAATYFNAWLVTSSKGDPQGIRPALEKISPEDLPEAVWRMVQVMLMEDRAAEALAVIEATDIPLVDNQFRYLPREYVEAFIYHLSGRQDRSRVGFEATRAHLEAKIEEDPTDPRYHAFLGLTNAFLGRREEAVQQASLAADLHPYSRDRLEGPYWLTLLAQVHAWTGDLDSALDQLEFLLDIEANWFVSKGNLTYHPIWSPLRGHPRFEALKEKAL